MRRVKTQGFRRRLLGVFLCLCMIMSAVGSVDPATAFAAAPENTETPELTEVPEPAESTEAPDPEASPEVSETPAPEASPEVSETPDPEASPEVPETPAPEASPEVPEEPEPTEDPAGQNYACLVEDGLEVSAIADPASGLPEDAELHAEKVEQGTEGYEAALAKVREKLGLGEGVELYFLPYDVYFTAGEEGRIEPEGGLVSVTMRFASDPFAGLLPGEGAQEPEAPADPGEDSSEEADPGGEGQDQAVPGEGDPAQDSPAQGSPSLEEPGMDVPGLEDSSTGEPEETAPAPEKVTERFVVHILADGTVEKLEPETAEDGTVTFAVASFSVMGPVLVRRMAAPTSLDPVVPREIFVPSAPEGVENPTVAGSIQAALEQLTDGGTVWLTADTTMDMVSLENKAVTIQSYDGASYTVTKSGTGENMFALTGGASLTLEQVTVDAANNTAGRTVTASGGSTLTLGAGAALVNNTAFGAVFLDGSTIIIEGGAIKNNRAAEGSAETKNCFLANNYFAYTFTAENGERQPLGGAVLMVNGSTFTMNSGEMSGNTAWSGGAVYASNLKTMSLAGGAISGNVAKGGETNLSHGGAIAVEKSDSCSINIRGESISNNTSGYNGAGLYIDWDVAAVDLTMTSGTFSDNHAGRNGAAICGLAHNAVIDISGAGSVFSKNVSATYGSIYLSKAAETSLPDSGRGVLNIHDGVTFTENTAVYGGALSVTKEGAINNVTLKNCVFKNNTASGNVGGACYVNVTGTTKVDGGEFTGNQAKQSGGACYFRAISGSLTIKKVKCVDNKAEQNGGAFYAQLASSTLTVDGGTYKENFAGFSGGAFFTLIDSSSSVTVQGGALFDGNSADVNAGAFSLKRYALGNGGTVQLLSCTVQNNRCNAEFDAYTGTDKAPTEHYNTGGIYVGEDVTCYMYDALITGNSVQSGYENSTVGSGIGLCPNAQVFLYPEHGAMIYGNGGSNTMDILAVPSDPVITHENPAKLYVSSTTPDGRAYHWTGLNGEAARTGEYDWTNEFHGIATASAAETGSGPVGFKANVADAGIMTTDASSGGGYSVIIADNFTKSALYGAGGVMVNGNVIAGNFNVTVKKTVTVNGGSSEKTEELQNDQTYKFRFSIIDKDSSSESGGLQVPENPVTYTAEKGSGGTLSFTRDTTTELEGTEDGYEGLTGKHARLYCDFTITGQDTITFRDIGKSEIGISSNNSYLFLLEETDSGGTENVVIEATDPPDTSTSTVKFSFAVTNTFNFGELDLTKTVAESPPGEKDKLFEFHIVLKESSDPSAEPLSGTFPVELLNGADPQSSAGESGLKESGGKLVIEFTSGEATVKLKHNQTLKIKDLPSGTSYTVTEKTDDNYTSSPNNAVTDVIKDPKEVDGDYIADPNIVTFTNTRKTGKLTVSKTVTGTGGDLNKEWTFNIVLKNSDGTFLPTGDYECEIKGPGASETATGKVTVNAEGKVTIKEPTDKAGEIKLKSGQSITIKDLPSGASYTVTELEANTPPYKTTSDKATGTIPDGSTADATVTAAFTNTAQVGKLTVSKTVADGGDTDKAFKFTIELKDGENPVNGDFSYEGEVVEDTGDDVDTSSKQITFTNGIATVYLKDSQTITINDLPAGVKYTVTEEAKHYTAKWEGDTNTGTITADGTASVKCTNTIISAELPDTGGPGFAGLAGSSALLCLAGCLIILSATGRRGKHSRRARVNHLH